jgi:predicted glycosyltransferase
VFRNRFYYWVKPFLPWSVRMHVRRSFARRKRERVRDVWPILPGSEKPPASWPGWPEGKQFSFVLTHDVEGPEGLAKVKPLAELEMSLGFRSCFNFIPEGPYCVTRELREWLVSNGFEVGVHDLNHDGHLYRNPRDFAHKARRINQYLKDWDAVGFRSGFMLRNLDWLHQLDVQYETSTFDTDPFEPQPHGTGTIFPFRVVRRTTDPIPKTADKGQRTEGGCPLSAVSGPVVSSNGYVELPYTLPQDSTLFLLLREQTSAIWIEKLDWIAQHGGMALVDVHPDYLQFEGTPPSARTYPVARYEELLRHVQGCHAGRYWQALPRRVGAFVAGISPQPVHRRSLPRLNTLPQSKPRAVDRLHQPKIWIDLDNTPHVPFFEPIIEELRVRGFPVLVTARDAFQVCDLADKKHLAYIRVGRHYGKNRLMKGAGLVYRALQLAPLVLRERPVLAVSHGSRSQLILGNCLRLPSVLLEDYEFCQFPPMMKPTWLMAPDVIPDAALCLKSGHLRKYPGIKEDVYAWKHKPDFTALQALGLKPDDLVVTVRPPATEAHYHNPESEKLFEAFMNRASRNPKARLVLLPRNKKQAAVIREQSPGWFQDGKTVIPQTALDGLNLIWHSDFVVSGGGTMNREAAALGVPVYSIFRGKIGAVDRHLCSEGRLTLVESLADVEHKIQIVKRTRKPVDEATTRKPLEHIVDTIAEIAESYAR